MRKPHRYRRGAESRITVARNRYIQAVQDYNVTVRSFPSNLTAMAFGYKEKPNFTVRRFFKHSLMMHRQVRRAFPRSTLAAIERAIKASEAAHVGEIRFAVEGSLDGPPLFTGQSPRDRAIDVFSQLRISAMRCAYAGRVLIQH